METKSSSFADMMLFAIVGILMLPAVVLFFESGLLSIAVSVGYILFMTHKLYQSLSYENNVTIDFENDLITVSNQNLILKSILRPQAIRFIEITNIKTTHTYYYRFFGQLVTRINIHTMKGRFSLIEYSDFAFGEKINNIFSDLILNVKRK